MFELFAENTGKKQISISVTVSVEDYKKAQECAQWLERAFNNVQIEDMKTTTMLYQKFIDPSVFTPSDTESNAIDMVDYTLHQKQK
jgi:hypothetical protein